MTKKDYIVLARALNSNVPDDSTHTKSALVVAKEQWEQDVVSIAEALKRDNPNMNYDRFFAACKDGE